MTSLTFYGGVNEIGGNKILLEDKDTRVFLDFGKGFSRRAKFFEEYINPRVANGIEDFLTMGLLPDVEGLYRDDLMKMAERKILESNVDAVLLSHAHSDHAEKCGQLLIMITMMKNIKSIIDTVEDKEYGKIIGLYLSFMLCKHINSNCTGVVWNYLGEKPEHALALRRPASIPYLKEWIQEHPLRSNPKSFLFISFSRQNRFGQLTRDGLLKRYEEQYRNRYFRNLLEKSYVPERDKAYLRNFLTKPWNLYIFRHSALTQKSQILKESTLRDHAGWSVTSKMPQVYIHYFGTEPSNSLLEAYGIRF